MTVLTTKSKLKTYLNISDTSLDAQIDQLLPEIDEAALRFARRKSFQSASRTEYHSGNGRQRLYLRHRPLTSVTDVWVDADGYGGKGDNPFTSDDKWVVGEDYIPASEEEDLTNVSELVAINRVWPDGLQNIKVTYTAGYTTIPSDLELAAHHLAAAVLAAAEEGKGGPLQSETLGQYAYTILADGGKQTGNDVAFARRILARYRIPIAV